MLTPQRHMAGTCRIRELLKLPMRESGARNAPVHQWRSQFSRVITWVTRQWDTSGTGDADKRKAILRIDPDKAPIVKWAFMRVYEGGMSLREVCDGVNARGLTTRYGNELSMQTFKNMLIKLVYTGHFWNNDQQRYEKAKWPGIITIKVYESVFEKGHGAEVAEDYPQR